jgi:acylaminoacyl-peptidase
MKKIFCLILMLLVAQGALAEKRAFTIEDYYAIKGVSDPQISPDGGKIAFVISENDMKAGKRHSEIFVMNADGSEKRQLTRHEKSSWHPRWSPNGEVLMFFSVRNEGTQIWLLPTSMGDPRQLTSLSTGVGDAEWSPDGKFIVFTSQVFPECGADDACNKKLAACCSGIGIPTRMVNTRIRSKSMLLMVA